MTTQVTSDKAIGQTATKRGSAGHALLGSTGDMSAEALLDGLRNLRFTGTIALTDGAGTMLLLLAKGQVEATFKLGAYDDLSAVQQGFHLYPHEATDLPRLPARNPASASPILRALPRLTPPERLRPGAVHLGRLLDKLAAASFGGAISYHEPAGPAIALLVNGTIRAAVHEAGGRLNSHAEALRALQRSEQSKAKGTIELEALDAAVMMPITAFAIEQSAPASASFSGLEVTATGYRYWKAGQPFLLVPGDTQGPQRRYALAEEATSHAPELALPAEPPGWEDQRYSLTLRGRDALDTMMELSMQFRAEFGREGQRILQTLGSGPTLEEAAATLGLELGKLKPWLERFEADGMLRRSGR